MSLDSAVRVADAPAAVAAAAALLPPDLLAAWSAAVAGLGDPGPEPSADRMALMAAGGPPVPLLPSERAFLRGYVAVSDALPDPASLRAPEPLSLEQRQAACATLARTLLPIQVTAAPLVERERAVYRRTHDDDTFVWQTHLSRAMRRVEDTLDRAGRVALTALDAQAPDSTILTALISGRLDGRRLAGWASSNRSRLLYSWLLRCAALPGPAAARMAGLLVERAHGDPDWRDAGLRSGYAGTIGHAETEDNAGTLHTPAARRRLLDAVARVPGSVLCLPVVRDVLGTPGSGGAAIDDEVRAGAGRLASAVLARASLAELGPWVALLPEGHLRALALDAEARTVLLGHLGLPGPSLTPAPPSDAPGASGAPDALAASDGLPRTRPGTIHTPEALDLLLRTSTLTAAEAETLLTHPDLALLPFGRTRWLIALLDHHALADATRRRALRRMVMQGFAPDVVAGLTVRHAPDLLDDPLFGTVRRAVPWRDALEDVLAAPDRPLDHVRRIVAGALDQVGAKHLITHLRQHPSHATRVPWSTVLAHPKVQRHPLRGVLLAHAARRTPDGGAPEGGAPADPEVTLRAAAVAGLRGSAERLRSSEGARQLLAELVRDGGSVLAELPRALVARLVRVAALGAMHWSAQDWGAIAPLATVRLAGEPTPELGLHLARRYLRPAFQAVVAIPRSGGPPAHGVLARAQVARGMTGLLAWCLPPLTTSSELTSLWPALSSDQRLVLSHALRTRPYTPAAEALSDAELEHRLSGGASAAALSRPVRRRARPAPPAVAG